MLIIPNEKIRKHISFDAEKGIWVASPDMPKNLEPEFETFKRIYSEYKKIKGCNNEISKIWEV